MSILLGRNGITPWIEEAALNDITADWKSHLHQSSTSSHSTSRWFHRPRPTKVVQVIACYLPTDNDSTTSQHPSNNNNQREHLATSKASPPYFILHDGRTSICAFLSEKIKSRFLQDQFARKPGSMIKISGWSFSSLVICTGKNYVHGDISSNHSLSWPLTLLIEDFVEVLGAEGTGQTIDRPTDVNESLRIKSTLITLTHWQLYQQLAMAYCYFNSESYSSVTTAEIDPEQYYLPDLEGARPTSFTTNGIQPHGAAIPEGADDQVELQSFSYWQDDDDVDDDQQHIDGINEMLSDGDIELENSHVEEAEIELFSTQQSQPNKISARPHMREPPRSESPEDTEPPQDTQFDTQRSLLDVQKLSKTHSSLLPERETESHEGTESSTELNFDTQQPTRLKLPARPQPHLADTHCNESLDETEGTLETQFDTQRPLLHVQQLFGAQLSPLAHCESNDEAESPMEPQFNTQQQLPLKLPTIPVVHEMESPSELQFDTQRSQFPQSSSMLPQRKRFEEVESSMETQFDTQRSGSREELQDTQRDTPIKSGGGVKRKSKPSFGAYFLDQLEQSDEAKSGGGVERKGKPRFGAYFLDQLEQSDEERSQGESRTADGASLKIPPTFWAFFLDQLERRTK